jgi:hypothetical protein
MQQVGLVRRGFLLALHALVAESLAGPMEFEAHGFLRDRFSGVSSWKATK